MRTLFNICNDIESGHLLSKEDAEEIRAAAMCILRTEWWAKRHPILSKMDNAENLQHIIERWHNDRSKI